jgi:cytochrome c553
MLRRCIRSWCHGGWPCPPRGPPSAAAPAKADPAKGQEKAAACMACHTADGSRGAGQPDPAGPAPEYLVKQLTEFKSGKRDNAIMKGMAAR